MPLDAQAILARLVAQPTIAGTGNVGLITEIAAILDGAGATVHVDRGTRSDTQVLHATVGPADAPDGVLVAAHGDVVDVEGQSWTSDPFTLRVAGGRLFGRGTSDMKGFVAAALAAIARADPARMRAPLHVAISHDEELGCAGVGPLLDRLTGARAPLSLAGVIVGEPTELQVVGRHKGKQAIDVTLRGRAAHSATPDAGVNAVRAAARLIIALEQLERELAGEATDRAFAVPHATVGIGPIAGGTAVNIVPELCTLKIELRMLPGQSPEALLHRVGKLAAGIADELAVRAPETGVDLERVAGYPPLTPAPGGARFADRIAALAGGGRRDAVDFGTEAGLYRERLGVPVVVCGPGSMEQGHTADEFLTTGQLLAGEAFIERLIGDLSNAP